MANRRKFLAGLGALASGSAAAMGTGAFTSVQANRSVNVAVAGDSKALLSLDPSSAANSAYVNASNGEISIDVDSTASTTGSGVNPDSTTQINDLFEVRNQGTQAAVVYVDPDSISDSSYTFSNSATGIAIDPQASNRPNGDYVNTNGISGGVEDDQITLTGDNQGPTYTAYQVDGGAKDRNGGGDVTDGTVDDALEEFVLQSGESFEFGLYVNADDSVDSSSSLSETIEIIADATRVPDTYIGD